MLIINEEQRKMTNEGRKHMTMTKSLSKNSGYCTVPFNLVWHGSRFVSISHSIANIAIDMA